MILLLPHAIADLACAASLEKGFCMAKLMVDTDCIGISLEICRIKVKRVNA
jgi:hypothetical protein